MISRCSGAKKSECILEMLEFGKNIASSFYKSQKFYCWIVEVNLDDLSLISKKNLKLKKLNLSYNNISQLPYFSPMPQNESNAISSCNFHTIM